jgi:DNA-binding response OmpR family regulator
MARVLVVEDEAPIRELVSLHLGLEGLECTAVADGREALERVASERFDLIVLDLMLPGVDGISVCRAARGSPVNADVPILILTARREEADKVVGLESGADDYLTKPFGVRELVARARALLRRWQRAQAAPDGAGEPGGGRPDPALRPVSVHGIHIDPARRRVQVEGRDVELTSQEFSLLHLLASHPGIVFTREAMLARVWKGETFVTERSADTLVKRLRRKIEPDPAEPRYVLTVWGVGYKFADV